jgi:hypothetical protein
MFFRKIRSAIFVDFQNIAGQLGPDFAASMPAWLAWLEDGAFDPRGRRRRFLEKRIYCDAPNHKKHAARFAQHKFDVIPTAADLAIALDALESTFARPRISEYIILTVDQDFAPLLEKLGDRRKDLVATVQDGTTSAAIFPDRADIVIPLQNLEAAFAYQRPPSLAARASTSLRRARTRLSALTAKTRRVSPPPEKPPATLAIGAQHLSTLAHKTPRNEVGRRTVMRYLTLHMPELKNGPGSLGCKDYADMVQQMVAIRDDLLLIRQLNGGVSVMAAPRPDAD